MTMEYVTDAKGKECKGCEGRFLSREKAFELNGDLYCEACYEERQ